MLGLLGYALKSYYATEQRPPHDRRASLLKLPILGNILRKVAVARFCRTLSTLLASGVPILDGLDITAKTAGNAIIEDAVQTTRSSIERGETISAPLRETNVFPSMVVQMINVGETTGALDAMLAQDRRLLRGRSRHRGGRTADADGAGHDRVPRRASSAASSSRCICRSST